MITENEISEILETEIPEMNAYPETQTQNKNVYQAMQCFAQYTKERALDYNLTAVKTCFTVAEKIWKEGNNTAKSIVENMYVFSISPLLEIASPIQYQVKKLLPENLRLVYVRQVNNLYP